LAQDVVRWLRNQDYRLKVSALSVGEFVNELVEDNEKDNSTKNDNMIYDFYNMVKAKEFRICRVEKSELSLFSKLIGEISCRDYRIHATDVLIVAQGMADGDCCGLLTFEGKLHNNKGIDEVRKDTLMERKFRVTDDPRKK